MPQFCTLVSEVLHKLAAGMQGMQHQLDALSMQKQAKSSCKHADFSIVLLQVPVAHAFCDPFLVFNGIAMPEKLPEIGGLMDLSRDPPDGLTYPDGAPKEIRISDVIFVKSADERVPVTIARMDPSKKLDPLDAVQLASYLAPLGLMADSQLDGTPFQEIYDKLCDGVI